MQKFGCYIAIFVILTVLLNHTTSNVIRQKSSVADGQYRPDKRNWKYKHDNRGKYVHVHIPYNGGYGPFEDPYAHDGRPYDHDDRTYNDKFDPFKANFFNDKVPPVRREYGAPLFS